MHKLINKSGSEISDNYFRKKINKIKQKIKLLLRLRTVVVCEIFTTEMLTRKC